MRVKILKEVHEDIRNGRLFYDAQERGVGQYFSSTVFADIRSLRNFAGIHTKQYGYFKMLMRRFPYAIYYDKDGADVTVVAVLDWRRDPVWIERRLIP